MENSRGLQIRELSTTEIYSVSGGHEGHHWEDTTILGTSLGAIADGAGDFYNWATSDRNPLYGVGTQLGSDLYNWLN